MGHVCKQSIWEPVLVRVLLLTTDAFGGHGGIALYNRDLAEALALIPDVSEVVVVPRTMPFEPVGIPDKVRFVRKAAGGKLSYILKALEEARSGFDLVVCGHINLLPLAGLLNLRFRARLVLMAYGIDVWSKSPALTRGWLSAVDQVWSISELTRERMNEWARLPPTRYRLLPNAIHAERYGLAERNPLLEARYSLQHRKVILTLARMPSFERYKGIDEVLEALPELRRYEPTLTYLIVGDGDDRPRLAAKAKALGMSDAVVFAGLISEEEKADHFRLADAFVMPGRGEGFGFVFLEALACGIPVVGSRLDGSREALLNGELGELVDPADPVSVRKGILRAVTQGRAVPAGLEYYSFARFRERLGLALHSLFPAKT